ncbi:hypothetical protein L218DRAFT_83726 [Marasmius fiardii PR-910]|nr:hypothetical protein L218DRAFT_83726 [Marasmius fiardii PR-910]
MIIEQKVPPPPYNPPAPQLSPTLTSLPHNILLQIVYSVFPQSDCPVYGDKKLVRQRETLHWLQSSLRLVNSSLYIACMHILRSTYLPAYNSLIRAPYSSDPFPSSSTSSDSALTSSNGSSHERPSLIPSHRELRTLDLFIALLTHEDLFLDSTSLHNPRHEAYKDLFVLIQPRSRLEDLVALEGQRHHLISLADDTINNGPTSFDSLSTNTLRRSESLFSLASEATLNEPSSSHSNPVNRKRDEDVNSPYVFSIPPTPRSSSLYSEQNAGVASTASLSQLPQLKRSKSIFSMFMSNKKAKVKFVGSTSPSPPPTPKRRQNRPIPFADLSVSLTPRAVALMYTPSHHESNSAYQGSSWGSLSMSHHMYPTRKRVIVEVPKRRDEPLEVAAKTLVRGLKLWMEDEC